MQKLIKFTIFGNQTQSTNMNQTTLSQSLLGLRQAESIYDRVVQLSDYIFRDDELINKAEYLKELTFLLNGVKGTDTILTIFNHKTYLPELEVGQDEFWGILPNDLSNGRMKNILSILHKDYSLFPYESVNWLKGIFPKIPIDERVNMKIHHCGMRFVRIDEKQIRLFSQGVPIQVDEERNFKYTLNYIQNIQHLIKKDFSHYWIRLAYGQQNELVQTFHSSTKESAKRDLLSTREKEILLLIAEDWDTKEIAKKLFISINTVGNHRSNMIERLGARDTTALVQLAKMTGMI
jgi:DNA-binding CsgD family transcriptional regulator